MYIKYYDKQGHIYWMRPVSGNLFRKHDRNFIDTGYVVNLPLAVECGSYREP